MAIGVVERSSSSSTPCARPSPFHHNILTLPRILTERHPRKSFLFNAHADPPTTTLQRLKSITTGSLPTFVDLGSNFGGSSIAEDSILNQLGAAGKRAAFMGDDTWVSVFPDAFKKNMTFPYDSFDVEDLHTVDKGLDDDTLLALGTTEWIVRETMVVMGFTRRRRLSGYSKGRDLAGSTASIPSGLLQYTTFPETTIPHRSVQQIDLLPTLSLLLGLPIPFNNLGTVIPELFWRDKKGKDLLRSMEQLFLSACRDIHTLALHLLRGALAVTDTQVNAFHSALSTLRPTRVYIRPTPALNWLQQVTHLQVYMEDDDLDSNKKVLPHLPQLTHLSHRCPCPASAVPPFASSLQLNAKFVVCIIWVSQSPGLSWFRQHDPRIIVAFASSHPDHDSWDAEVCNYVLFRDWTSSLHDWGRKTNSDPDMWELAEHKVELQRSLQKAS
ncbi:hypothetical protein C8J56DRAFT_1061212 [Mycena floridula]|nr:hypothetical protein C8J56DRAFT_1061212 [Mycena floridula]